jgi:hypothetical protein
MSKKIALLIIICIPFLAISQNKTSYNETVFLDYNASNYLVGETIYFKLYNLNASNHLLSNLSKVAYIEIIDKNKKSITKQKLFVENGIAYGDIFLPVEIETGIYKLIAYTSYMTNKNISSYFIDDIAIINPYQSILSSNLDFKQTNDSMDFKTVYNKDLEIKIDKKNFSTREKAQVVLIPKLKDLKTNLSISVRKIDAFKKTNNIKAIDVKTNEISNNSLLNYKVPELRGEIISGKIIAIDNDLSTENKAVALSLPGKNFSTKIVKTNNKGEFHFTLEQIPNISDAVIQIMEDDRTNYKIQLIENNIDFSELNIETKVKITPEIKKLIEKKSIANQIENAYFSLKKDTIKDENTINSFYHPYEKIIKLDDYTRFPLLKETIIEILPEVFFKEKNNHYSINIRSNENNLVGLGVTLTLIDGLIIQNAEELFEYDTRNIDRIEFVNKKYVYGPRIFNGIINFITKNYDYQLKDNGSYILKTEIQRPSFRKYYYNQDYSDVLKYERIPDYRNQLLWIPNLNVVNNKTISFYTSDIKGTFEISIEGFTDKGQPISIKEYFEVK